MPNGIKYDFTLYIFILFSTENTVNEGLGPIKDRLFVSIKKPAFVIHSLLLRVHTMLYVRGLLRSGFQYQPTSQPNQFTTAVSTPPEDCDCIPAIPVEFSFYMVYNIIADIDGDIISQDEIFYRICVFARNIGNYFVLEVFKIVYATLRPYYSLSHYIHTDEY